MKGWLTIVYKDKTEKNKFIEIKKTKANDVIKILNGQLYRALKNENEVIGLLFEVFDKNYLKVPKFFHAIISQNHPEVSCVTSQNYDRTTHDISKETEKSHCEAFPLSYINYMNAVHKNILGPRMFYNTWVKENS